MNKIEEYIKKNLKQFNSNEPENDHFIHMEQKIMKLSSPKKQIRRYNILKYAAVFILLILTGLGTYDLVFDKQSNNVSLSIFPEHMYLLPEYAEAEVYYTSQINQKMYYIDHYQFNNDSTEKAMLDKEISEMDNLLKNIKKELNTNPNDERVISIAISYYQMKLNVLNKIIKQLNIVEQLNYNNYENTNL